MYVNKNLDIDKYDVEKGIKFKEFGKEKGQLLKKKINVMN